MAAQQTPLYQGRDWFTYRWTIAEAFDMIERMQDICLCQDWAETDIQTDDETTMLQMLADFAYDLACTLDIACADTIPATSFFGTTRHKWQCREIRCWEQIILEQVEEPTQQPQEIALVLAEIKQLLRAIDT